MLRPQILRSILVSILPSMIAICGCGGSYQITYDSVGLYVPRTGGPLPLKIAVATLSDKRDAAEREKDARRSRVDADSTDLGDYTYDRDFRGEVVQEVTEAILNHLNHLRVFVHDAKLIRLGSENITESALDSLRGQGFDAVMTGELKHFYGYYDQNEGLAAVYGLGLGLGIGIPLTLATMTEETHTLTDPFGNTSEIKEPKTNPVASYLGSIGGASLGVYLESLRKRDTEGRTEISAMLRNTSSHRVIWAGSFNEHHEEFTSIPGMESGHRKHELAVNSLQEVASQMIRSLAETARTATK